MSKQANHYQVLNVSRTATAQEIKRAYYKLAKQTHPDATGNDKTCEERFKRISEAHRVLCNAKMRKAYDQRLAAEDAERLRVSPVPNARQPTAASWPVPPSAAVRQSPPPPVHSAAMRPHPRPQPPATSWLNGLLAVGIVVVGSAMIADAMASDQSRYDRRVQRRRGSDGRFVRSRTR